MVIVGITQFQNVIIINNSFSFGMQIEKDKIKRPALVRHNYCSAMSITPCFV